MCAPPRSRCRKPSVEGGRARSRVGHAARFLTRRRLAVSTTFNRVCKVLRTVDPVDLRLEHRDGPQRSRRLRAASTTSTRAASTPPPTACWAARPRPRTSSRTCSCKRLAQAAEVRRPPRRARQLPAPDGPQPRARPVARGPGRRPRLGPPQGRRRPRRGPPGRAPRPSPPSARRAPHRARRAGRAARRPARGARARLLGRADRRPDRDGAPTCRSARPRAASASAWPSCALEFEAAAPEPAPQPERVSAPVGVRACRSTVCQFDAVLAALFADGREALGEDVAWFDAHTHIGHNDPDGLRGRRRRRSSAAWTPPATSARWSSRCTSPTATARPTTRSCAAARPPAAGS